MAAIVSGRSFTFAYLFLSLLYKSFFTIIEQLKSEEDIKTIPRPLWFLPLSIYQYFLEFVRIHCFDVLPPKQLSIYRQILQLFTASPLSVFEVANRLLLCHSGTPQGCMPFLVN